MVDWWTYMQIASQSQYCHEQSSSPNFYYCTINKSLIIPAKQWSHQVSLMVWWLYCEAMCSQEAESMINVFHRISMPSACCSPLHSSARAPVWQMALHLLPLHAFPPLKSFSFPSASLFLSPGLSLLLLFSSCSLRCISLSALSFTAPPLTPLLLKIRSAFVINSDAELVMPWLAASCLRYYVFFSG